MKLSTIVAFVVSMAVTTFLTVTSYLGIGLFVALRRQARYEMQWERRAHTQLVTRGSEDLTEAA
jgi:hypothetical protein